MTTNTYPTRTKSEWIVQFKENPNSVKETIEEVLGEKISSGNVDDFFEDQEVLDTLEGLFEWDEYLRINANVTSWACVKLDDLDRQSAYEVLDEQSHNHASDWDDYDDSELTVDDRNLEVTVLNLRLKLDQEPNKSRSRKDAMVFYDQIKPIFDRYNPSLKKVGEESPAWMDWNDFVEKVTKDITAKLTGQEL